MVARAGDHVSRQSRKWNGVPISTRALHALDDLRIQSVADIARTRERDVIMLKNVGRKTFAELRELAIALGTSFADPIEFGTTPPRCSVPGCVRKLGHGDWHFALGGRTLSGNGVS